jgi:hypothetical protein
MCTENRKQQPSSWELSRLYCKIRFAVKWGWLKDHQTATGFWGTGPPLLVKFRGRRQMGRAERSLNARLYQEQLRCAAKMIIRTELLGQFRAVPSIALQFS